MSDVLGTLKKLFPSVRVTSAYRGPNHPLTRKNPRSYHALGSPEAPRAIDVAPIPGVSFDDYVGRLKANGLPIAEARDEVTNPSSHATGPHWHIGLGDKPVTNYGGFGGLKKPRMTTPPAMPSMEERAARFSVNIPLAGVPLRDYTGRFVTAFREDAAALLMKQQAHALEDAGDGSMVWRDAEGHMVAFNMVHRSGVEGWMGPLAVRSDHQGSGAGKEIVRRGIDWLKVHGATTIGLETMPRTMDNIGFYSRLGFVPGHLTVTLQRDRLRVRSKCHPGSTSRELHL